MRQILIDSRPHWKDLALEYGFDFYQTVDPLIDCWKESVYYEFRMSEIERIETATQELHYMCLDLVQEVCGNSYLMTQLGIPEYLHNTIKKEVDRSGIPTNLYGRFDFAYNELGPLKLLEYNADTPTALFESAVWQWRWLEDGIKSHDLVVNADQFNSIHEKLIDRWKLIADTKDDIYFTCMGEYEEDRGTVRYLEDTASQAGFKTKFINIQDIGFANRKDLCDLDDKVIKYLFKLYPWEWLVNDAFATHIPHISTSWIEPIWKMILSNKGMLALLWERHPNHPNLLECYFDGIGVASKFPNGFVRKPLLSREGANITIVKDNKILGNVPGMYGKEGYVRQAIADIPVLGQGENKKHIIIGSWVVGDDPAGMIVRESDTIITNNISQLVPHIING